MINSGGAPSRTGDLARAVPTAVINERAGDVDMIFGREADQRSMREDAALLSAIQDVYLSDQVIVA